MLNIALKYREKNCSIIPLNPFTKKPYFLWKQYQTVLPTVKEINTWWSEWPTAMVALLTGKISGVTVVDFDMKTGGLETLKTLRMPPTLTVETPGGGLHYYYQYNAELYTRAGFMQGVDIRNDGGYAVAAHSKRSDGKEYAPNMWDVDIFSPDIFGVIGKEVFGDTIKKVKGNWKNLLTGVVSGKRNSSAASVAGALLRNFRTSDWKAAWELYLGWNQRNNPPLDEKELETTFLSIANSELSRRKEQYNFFKE